MLFSVIRLKHEQHDIVTVQGLLCKLTFSLVSYPVAILFHMTVHVAMDEFAGMSFTKVTNTNAPGLDVTLLKLACPDYDF